MTNVSAVEKMAELIQQMEENSPRVAALQYCLTQVAEKVEEAEKRNAELEARCAALAAENAGLKAACERVSMWNEFPQATLRSTGEVVPYVVAYGSNGERDYMRNIATTALKETPATDAFLAEVRASGVEMAMEHMQSSGSLTFGDCYISLNDFADQLRKGVQS